MEFLVLALVVIYVLAMAAIGRMCGGGLGAEKLRKKGSPEGGVMPYNLSWIPEVLFGLGLGLPVTMVLKQHELWLFMAALVGAGCSAWSYGWMETGHRNAYSFLFKNFNPWKPHTLDPVVQKICRQLGVKVWSKQYCWVFMGVKGFLIGLPIFPFGLLLTVIWPAWYAFGAKQEELGRPLLPKMAGTEIAEYGTAGSAGLLAIIFMITFV